jgi:hypothetical protein
MDRWERRLSCQRYYTSTRASTYTDVHPSIVKSQWNLALAHRSQGILLQLELYLAAVQPAPSRRKRVGALI